MNSITKNPLLVAALGAILASALLPVPLSAQTFTPLHSFAQTANDGANPAGGLISSEGVLYGTTSSGGSSGYGTVFKVNTDGSGFRLNRVGYFLPEQIG